MLSPLERYQRYPLSHCEANLNLFQKYTVQSHGIWERIRSAFAVDPTRSTGVPLNLQFRNPTPGANPPSQYDDPVTVPSGDIAENPYYKRDIRRSYPKSSVLSQADVVGLLTVGSKATPKEGSLQVGEAGTRQLVELTKTGEQRGLSAFFEDSKANGILDPKGLPPSPTGLHQQSADGMRAYTYDKESGYPDKYVFILSDTPIELTNVAGTLVGYLDDHHSEVVTVGRHTKLQMI